MANTYRITALSGLTVYFAIIRPLDNKVFDFNDNSWQASGDVVDPQLPTTPASGLSGDGRSDYVSDELDLALIGNADILLRPFSRVGGSPDLSADRLLGGDIAQTNGIGEAEAPCCRFEFTKKTNGQVQISVWLEQSNEKVDLSAIDGSATARIIAREHGAASGTLTIDTDDPAATWSMVDDLLECVIDDPGFNDNVQYMVDAELTADGTTYRATQVRAIWGT